MRIASIGDLHLTPVERQDKFWGPERPLASLMHHLAATHDWVVLAGDVYQADYGRRPGSDPDVIAGVERRYRTVFDLIRRGRFIQLAGNHDRVAETCLGAPRQARFERDGLKILIEHGHRFDQVTSGRKPDLIMWALGRLRALGLGRLCDLFEAYVLDPLHTLALGSSLERGAAGLLAREGWNIVVMGHTHEVACLPHGRGLYVNAGACTMRHPRFLSIDTRRATVQVREFDGVAGSRVLVNHDHDHDGDDRAHRDHQHLYPSHEAAREGALHHAVLGAGADRRALP